MVTTLKFKWHFAVLAALLYSAYPIVNAIYYMTQQSRGAYPPEADTIAIPIYGTAIAILALSPLYALIVWLATRSYRGGRPLLAFDTARPISSAFWSLLVGGIALYCLGDAVYSVYRMLPLESLSSVVWAYLLLCLRSSLAGDDHRAAVRGAT